jgi:hypothetical protein
MIAVDRKDNGAVVLLNDAVDAALAVVAFDLVFADRHPRIAINHARTQAPD